MASEKPSFNIKAELQPRAVITTLTAALVTGVIAVSNTISYGALIFTNELSPYLSNGVGVALFSGLVLSMIVALMGSGLGLVDVKRLYPPGGWRCSGGHAHPLAWG